MPHVLPTAFFCNPPSRCPHISLPFRKVYISTRGRRSKNLFPRLIATSTHEKSLPAEARWRPFPTLSDTAMSAAISTSGLQSCARPACHAADPKKPFVHALPFRKLLDKCFVVIQTQSNKHSLEMESIGFMKNSKRQADCDQLERFESLADFANMGDNPREWDPFRLKYPHFFPQATSGFYKFGFRTFTEWIYAAAYEWEKLWRR